MLTGDELRQEAWTWSFSKFKQYHECREKYRLHYLEQMRLPPLSGKPFFQGSVAHKLVEQARDKLLKGEVDSLHRAKDALNDVFFGLAQGLPWQDDAEIARALIEADTLLENYLELLGAHDLDKPPSSGTQVECEYWFGTHAKPLVRTNGLRLVGAIDWLRIDQDQRKAWIFDAKTSQGTQYLDKRQLVLYALAVEQVFGVEVEQVGFLMLRWKRPLLYSVTAAEKASLEQELVAASQHVEAQLFGAQPSVSLCATCQYSGHCGPYRHWILNGGSAAEVGWDG